MKRVTRNTSRRKPDVDWDDLTPLDEVDHPLTVVLYGRPGTGKTTIAGTFPTPILYLDIRDKGTASLGKNKGIQVKSIEESEDLEDIRDRLRADPKRFKTVVLDTVSQLYQMVTYELMSHKKLKSGKRLGDWGTMSQQDWGKVAGQMKDFIVDFRNLSDLGMNIVFIAQEKTTGSGDEETEGNHVVLTPEVGPSLGKSTAEVLNAAVEVIGSTFIRVRDVSKEVKGKRTKERKMEFCLRLGPNPVYVTKVRKDRTITVPAVLVDPTYDDIIDIRNGE